MHLDRQILEASLRPSWDLPGSLEVHQVLPYQDVLAGPWSRRAVHRRVYLDLRDGHVPSVDRREPSQCGLA